MVIQINPAGSLPVSSVVTAPAPAAVRPAPARVAGVPAQPAGTEAVAVAQVNQHLQQSQTDLKLQVDPASGRTVFQIVQKGTGALVLQIPSAEVLGMSRRVREMEAQIRDSGTLVDQQG